MVTKNFTADQDTHLIEFLAKNNPGLYGRCGDWVYKLLVENVDGQWNWSSSHAWFTWRDHYRKNRFEFNQRIESYHRKHGLPMERVNSRRYTFFTPEDDAFLVEYLAKYNPEISGRTRTKLYQRLVDNVDDRWWSSRHSLGSWQGRYYNKKAEFDQRILQYQLEHKKSTAQKKGDPIRKRPSRKRKQKSTSLADAPKTLSIRQNAARIRSNSPGLRVQFQTDPPTESDDNSPSKRETTSNYTRIRNAGDIRAQVHEMGIDVEQRREARLAVVSSSPRHPSAISSSRDPATETGRASVDVRPSTSPHPAQSPIQHRSTSLQASQSLSPLHWASPTPSVFHVEPAIEDTHQLPACIESPLERRHVVFTPRLGNQHLLCPVFNPGPWKPPSMLSQVELRVESSEDNDRPLPIYPPHTLGNQGSLWDMMKSGTPPLEKVVYSSPGDDVENSSLHTARPPRRLRLFQPRPVSTDNSQRHQQDRGGPTVQQIPATHGFDAEVVRQVYDASRDHIKAERVLYRMRQAADAVRKAALD
ncbi:hypothetical protein C8R43DRAFT_1024980 [Mycena crocata]|nr:hypothetical protein C8R43DRAFT_1024980 [Mycena crocata]